MFSSHHMISSRRQCIAMAVEDGIDWARQAVQEEIGQHWHENGEPPSDAELADALELYDRGMGGLSESPAYVAGVPSRWAPIYDRALERAYRRAIRREIASLTT